MNWNPFKKKSVERLDSPEKIYGFLQDFGQTYSGEKITPHTAMQIATVYSCVRVLAESIGTMPLEVFDGRSNTTTKVNDTPLARLLRDGPNDYMTPIEYKELIVVHLMLRGNHYSYKNKVAGRVVELLPLNPASVQPCLNDDWTVEYEVTFPDGSKDMLKEDDVFHVRLFTHDGLQGLSPISYARNTLGLAKATERHGNALFKNAAKPSGGFKTDQALKPDQVQSLKEQLDDYTGENVHKNLILQGGLSWFQTTMTSEDAQFLETRKYQRSEICGLFKVPPHMIGDLERATFSNIEHQSLDFVKTALVPIMTRIEERIKKNLLSNPNHFAKFNDYALIRGDMASRASFYRELTNLGALSPNEIRDFEDLDRREGGDIYLTPLNMAVNGEPIQQPSQPEPTPLEQDQDDDDQETL